MRYLPSLLAVALIAFVSSPRAQTPVAPLAPLPINGAFDTTGPNWEYVAEGWKRSGYWGTESQPNDVRREMDGKNPYVWVVSGAGLAKGTVLAVLKDPILLSPEWRRITVKFRARLTDFEPGLKKWECARLQLVFLAEDGTQFKTYPSVHVDPSTEWKVSQKTLEIPVGAHSVSCQFGFWGSQGNLDLDDLELIPVK